MNNNMPQEITITNLSSNTDFGTISNYKATTSSWVTKTISYITSYNYQYLTITWQLPRALKITKSSFDCALQAVTYASDPRLRLYASTDGGTTKSVLYQYDESNLYSGSTFTKAANWTGSMDNVNYIEARIGAKANNNNNILKLRNLSLTYEEPDAPVDDDSDSDTDLDADTDLDSDLDTDTDIDTDTDADTDTDTDIDSDTDVDIDTDIDTDNDGDFEITTVWHDEDGHIYKDKLIEVFDSIEAKINELADYDISEIDLIDITNITYPDVTTTDVEEDSTKIVNLKSFVNIMDLAELPLSVTTDGNVGIKTCTYVGNDYLTHTIDLSSNPTVASTTNPYIHLDIENNTIVAYSSFQSDKPLLGLLKNNKLITNNARVPANVNFLKVLADQARPTSDNYASDGNQYKTYYYSNQTVAGFGCATKARGGQARAMNTNFGLTDKLREEKEGEE